jgi:SHS2 domain-containing protein
MGDFRFFDHMADVGIDIQGESSADLFLTAAHGLMAWIGDSPSTASECPAQIAVEADDAESLLVCWMQELLYCFYQKHFYPTSVPVLELDLERFRLKASLRGKTWEERLYPHYREVKAITYHKLKIERIGASWCAKIVLDI